MTSCDLAIVGLGAVGSAALLAAARDGIDVIGLDRHAPPHTLGSTHGETRIVRAAIGEGVAYSPLALRSFVLWDQLRDETGVDLVDRCGALILGGALPHATHVKAGFFDTTIAAAREYAIPHEILDAAEVRARFPAFATFEGDAAYFEPGAGLAYPERVVATQIARATALGGRSLLDTRVIAVTQEAARVSIVHAGGEITARRAIVSAGAWAPEFLPPAQAASLRVLRQTLHWFDVADAARADHMPARMPVFIWNELYGFPLVGADGVKIATEDMTNPVDPDAVSREITAGDIETVSKSVRVMFPQLGAHRRATVCLYTATPDSNFRIGPHPRMDRVTVVSACSGHGFKHSAAVGEAAVNNPAALAAWAWEGP